MDPVSMIVMALATGAAAALKPTAEAAIKDAYAGIKTLIQRKYAPVSIELLEADPASGPRQDVVKEDLARADAGKDEEVLREAKALLDAIQRQDPDAAQVVGVTLEDIKGASLRLENIISAGHGVSVKRAEMQGDIEIKDVVAGGREAHPKP